VWLALHRRDPPDPSTGELMSERTLMRVGAICGVLSIALLLAGGLMASIGAPGPQTIPADVLDWSARRNAWIEIGHLALTPAVFLFLRFIGAVRALLGRHDSDGGLTTVAVASSLLYVGLTLTGGVLSVTSTAALAFFDHFQDPQAVSGYFGISAGFELTAAAAPVATAMIVATALVARRSGLIPVWLFGCGIALALIALTAGLFGFGFTPFGIWTLVLCGVLLRAARVPAEHAIASGVAQD
jgi:hypothetical protein